MNFNKTLSVAAAAAMAVSVVAVSVSAAEPMTQDDIGAQIFVMGNGAWSWYAVEVKCVDGVLSADINAADLIAGSKKDNDAAVGQFGIQFTNPIGKAESEFKDGETAKELADGTSYSITYTLKKEDGTVIKEGTVKDSELAANGNYGQAVNIEILGNGTSWDELEAFGTMKFEATVAWNGPTASTEEEAPAEETEAEVPAEETTAETEVEPTVEEEVEAEVEEEVEEETDEETEEETEEEAPAGDVLFDEEGVTLTQVGGEGTSNNWGQAVVMYTYNNIAEDEEPGENPFDVSLLNENSCIVVYYESDVAPELILQSWSGGNGWAKVPQNEDESAPGMAVFTYDYMTAMYESDDFSTLDAVNIGDQGAELTVNGVYVLSLTDEAAAEIEASIEETEDETADTTVEETAPAADSADTTAPKTGNAGLAAIAGVIAVAGAAAVTFKKRK